MPTISQAKEQLDVVIGKQRSHMYKPIQVAEILYKVRTTDELAMEDIHKLEEYRTKSRHWRAEVSRYLNNLRFTEIFAENYTQEACIRGFSEPVQSS
jgi:hypothetical protein